MDEDQSAVVVDARRGPLPDKDWAGIIVTGSGSSVFDPDPWIRAAGDFLKRAAEKGSRIYGVCFGHQLIAQTFGGKVERCAGGWELGTAPIRILPDACDDELFAGVPVTFVAQQTHRDVVSELPPGAVRLAENDHARVQAFRLGERVWGTQFHPEFSRGLMDDMVNCLAADLAEEKFVGKPRYHTLTDWLLAGVRESPEASKCLANFVRLMVLALVIFLAGVEGCSTKQNGEVLVNPMTGRLVRCDLLKGEMAAKCVDVAQKRGYVPPDKLTAEQRARFKSQSAVTVETLTPQEQRFLDQRGVLPPDAIPSIP